MNVVPPLTPGSWATFWAYAWPWAAIVVALITLAVVGFAADRQVKRQQQDDARALAELNPPPPVRKPEEISYLPPKVTDTASIPLGSIRPQAPRKGRRR